MNPVHPLSPCRQSHSPIFLLLFFLTGLSISNPVLAQAECRVAGYIEGIGKQPIIFIYTLAGQQILDTVYAENDRFSYTVKPNDEAKIAIYIRSPRFFSFWYEPGTVTLTGDVAQPHLLTVSGTPDNDRLNQYNQNKQSDPKEFIKNNPDALTSADLLYWALVEKPAELPQMETLFLGLTERVRESPPGRKAAAKLLSVRNQPVVGQTAPNFAIPDTAGRMHTLESTRGKYVLLDFWGTWCAPCMRAIPKLKTLQQQYAAQMTLVGIAAESEKNKLVWIRTIREKNLNWLHLSELKTDKGPVTARYNIEGYPTYVLLDPNGVILERSYQLSDIEARLQKLFN